ncbi:slit homolog 1 protein-like [Saccostrea echinata]|uniref:slit homolog 1 protein-like n=1 Tax=Saccostrea echinata TaxID=191078 RepID=UPI002A839BA2|nr:slit homolog 1 protein-like [Saccostrea echinata]
MRNNKIQNVHPRAFSGLKFDLIYIHLQGDGKTAIPFHSLHNLKSLRTVILVNFALHYMDNSVSFHLLPNLRHLSLINMGTTFFSSYTFDSNANRLTEFQFRDNPKVSTFPVGAMKNLFYVQKLVWTGNEMTVIPAHAFRDLAHLLELDISKNELNKIETHSFSGVTEHIRQLNLSRNKLTAVSILEEFSRTQWIALQHLNLSDNNINHLEEAIFKKMEKLIHLDLSSNGLTSISASNFQHLHNLQKLDLSRNSLHSVDIKAFTWTRSLNVLDLQRQATDRKPTDFTNAHDNSIKLNIKKINLSHTRLIDSNFWQFLQRVPVLKHLHAAHSGLSMLMPGGFRQTKLTHISLQNNYIYELFPETFSGLEDSLEILNLKSNRLSKIDERVFKNLRSLKVIDLSLNQIECNCTMQWFWEWLKLNSTADSVLGHSSHRYNLKCSNFYENGDINFETAMSDLECENDTRRINVNVTSTPLISVDKQQSFNWVCIYKKAIAKD